MSRFMLAIYFAFGFCQLQAGDVPNKDMLITALSAKAGPINSKVVAVAFLFIIKI